MEEEAGWDMVGKFALIRFFFCEHVPVYGAGQQYDERASVDLSPMQALDTELFYVEIIIWK